MVRAIDPAAAGIGLRAPHYASLLERRPALGFLEVHSENFFGAGGAPLAWLERFRDRYALSFHGVGLSLGSADPLDETHLSKLDALVRRFEPTLVSEHLSWSSFGGRHANDLLPLPYTEEALDHACARIARVQERLGRPILIENVSAYMRLPDSAMPEWEFVNEAARRSGCGILLDLNNVFVNSRNLRFEPARYVDAIDAAAVGEIHLAGHEAKGALLIDTHGARVCEGVWDLHERAVERFGPRPTLVEWDTDLPALDVLLAEASRARAINTRAPMAQAAE